GQLLTRLLADAKFVAGGSGIELIRELAGIVGVRGQTAEMQHVLTSAGVTGAKASSVLRDAVGGIGEGLKRSGKSLRQVQWDAETSGAIDRLLSQAAQTAADSQAPLDARTAAIRLLTFDNFDRVKPA